MANHGYLGEGFGRSVDDDRVRGRADERQRQGDREGSREWFGGRERSWDPAREGWGGDPGGRRRESGSDFSRGRGEWADENRDRGMFDRVRETARSWMRDDDEDDRWRGGGSDWRMSHYGREHGTGGFQGDYGGGRNEGGFGGRGDWQGGRQNMSPSGRAQRSEDSFGYNDLGGTTGGFGNQTFGSTPHDHYLRWRERQIAELDRDYQDYCREREQSFHQDFDSWRQSRQGRQQQQQQDPMRSRQQGADTQAIGQAGSTSSVGTSPPQEPLELTDESSAATLGAAETPRGGPSRG
ncbi:MAG TPA: hypothetical protein VM265_06265 [Sphingomicrobium sp.]|nr:hypothetical protein [Sphingomicrobium sp.]